MAPSSTTSISKWERQYSVLKHPVLGTKVIRLDCGSLWVIVIGPLYLLFKKLWLKAFLFIALTVILGLIDTTMESSWFTIFILGMNLLLLFKTGRWVEADMVESRGWQRLGICNAKSGEQALAIIQSQHSGESADMAQPPIQFKPTSVWKRIGLGFVIGIGVLVAFFAIVMTLSTSSTGPNQTASNQRGSSNGLPACDSFKVKFLGKSAIIGTIPLMARADVIGIKEISTLAVKDDQNQCRAIIATGAGRVQVDYAVSWINKERDGWTVGWIASPHFVEE